MSSNFDIGAPKRIFFAIVFFLGSGWYTFSEINYALRGQTALGEVTNISRTTERTRRFRKRHIQQVDYRFTDLTGNQISHHENVPLSWTPPQGGKLPIQYIAGQPNTSRIAGRPNYIAMICFGISVGWLAIVLFMLVREAQQANAEIAGTKPRVSKKSRSKRPRPAETD